MTEREKLFRLLLNAFSLAFSLDSITGLDWNSCALFFPDVKFQEAIDYLLENGVTVRKMQKPLTEEEVIAMPDVVWVEWSHGDIEPKIPCTIEMSANRTLYCFTDDTFLRLSDHGKTWRCWAKRPTEEERKAAVWME